MPTILPPSRFEAVCRCLSYLSIAAIGIWVALQPMESNSATLGMSAALGHILTLIWAVLMATAAPAAVSALTGRYRTEYVALPVFGAALILATGFVWGWAPAYPGLIGRALVSTALCFQLGIRFRTLHRLTRQGGAGWIPDFSS